MTAMATNSAKKFSNSLSKLARDIDELRKDSHELKEYDKLCNEQSALKYELSEKNQEIDKKVRERNDLCKSKDERITSLCAEIGKLKSDDEVLTRRYQTQFRDWDTDKKKHSIEAGRLSQLQKDCQYWKQKAEQAEQAEDQLCRQADERLREAEDRQTNIDQLERSLQMKSLMMENALAERDSYQKQLVDTNKEIGILAVDQRQSINELEKLASRSEDLIRATFSKKSPRPEVYINVSSPVLARIPQVASNSAAAFHMRCALAEAIIAEKLSACIFRDFYIPASDVPNLRELIETLSWLDEKHPRRASIARCQITMALETPQAQDSIIVRAVESVRRSLDPWMLDNTVRERFEHDLTKFFRDAMSLWQRLRLGPKHPTASVSVTSDQWDALEDARQQFDKVTIDEQYKYQEAAVESSLPTAVLFPQIWIGNEVLFHGHALFPSQSAVIAATLENKRKNTSNNSIKRRRQSETGMVHAPDPASSEGKAMNAPKHRAQGL